MPNFQEDKRRRDKKEGRLEEIEKEMLTSMGANMEGTRFVKASVKVESLVNLSPTQLKQIVIID